MAIIRSQSRETDDLIVRELNRFAKYFDSRYESFLRKEIGNPLLLERVLYAVSLIGVRERALLVRISSLLCEVKWNRVLPAALAAECFISSALTGDDIVDEAETRWRKPTVWKRWGNDQGWLVAEMLHVLAQSAVDRLQHHRAAELLRSAFKRFFEGQFREIVPKKDHSHQDAIELAMERTGSLLQACLVVPAIIGDSPFQRPLAVYGKNFGTAFQLADDVFDFLGDPKVMGKPILGDLLNGQPIIVLAHVLNQRNSQPKRIVTRWYGKGVENCPKDVRPILEAAKALGSIDFACNLVNLHVKKARNVLDRIPKGKPRRLLEGFLTLILRLPVNNGE